MEIWKRLSHGDVQYFVYGNVNEAVGRACLYLNKKVFKKGLVKSFVFNKHLYIIKGKSLPLLAVSGLIACLLACQKRWGFIISQGL